MVIAVSPKARFPWQDPADVGKEAGTVFYLRHLSEREQEQLDNSCVVVDSNTQEFGVRFGTMVRQACLAGIVGWEHFYDEQGQPIAFETVGVKLTVLGMPRDHLKPELLERIPDGTRKGIFHAVRGGRHLTPEDAKN